MTYAAFAAIDEGVRLAKAGGLDPTLLIDIGRANGVVTPQMEAFFGNREQLAAAGVDTLRKAFAPFAALGRKDLRSEEHTSELQSLMRTSYAVFCLTKKTHKTVRQQRNVPARHIRIY